MRSGLILSLSLLISLSACADVTSCVVREGAEQPCTAGAIQYTNVPAQEVPSRVVPIRIDRSFSMYERAKIFRAVNEWNVVLNGQVRLDISPENFDATPYKHAGAARPEGWIVARIDSRDQLVAGSSMSRALAITLGTRRALIAVVADRLGSRDLGSIMMHEFGHAFGLGHDPSSKLMHPYYTGDMQRCIDRGTVRAVAAAQNLAFERLNWCGAGHEQVARAPANVRGRTAWIAIRNQ